MKHTWQKRIGIVCLGGCVGLAMFILAGAAPDSGGKAAAVYEYKTASGELKSLQMDLNKLGKDGWDVVWVVRDDLILNQADDGKNHIRTVGVTIVAKRRQRR